VFTAEEMRAVDRRAVAELGLSGATLMENAGRAAAEVIAARLAAPGGGRRARSVVVVCGKGGNGGDGFVVARALRGRGVACRVILACAPSEIRGDAALKLAALRRARVVPILLTDDAGLAAMLRDATLVVDALLGTGTRGAPTGAVVRAIEAINASGTPVVALDIPSGLDADTGRAAGAVVRAALTITFAGLKRGLVVPPGSELAGEVRVASIGVADHEVARGATVFMVEARDVAAHVPPRPRDAHKGTYGHLLVVAGSLGKTGAAALAATAAMRAGVGLVTVATPRSQQPIVAALAREPMTAPLAETSAGTVSRSALGALRELAAARDAVAMGPGLGVAPETQEVARQLARELECPVALDADALTALAGHLDVLRDARGARCLTPHPGEMARMLGLSTDEVQRDRIEVTRAFARAHGVHCVLKGAASVIATPDGDVFLNPTGNPGMASGGTGDVLTGVLGAFLARRVAPAAALISAVYLHGLAGDLAAARMGEESLVAGDLVDALPLAFRALADPAAPSRAPR
jgi:NAD(P)H-hydrate epimerase